MNKKLHYILGMMGTLILGVVPIYLVGQPSIIFPLPFYQVLCALGGVHILILTCLLIFYVSSILVFDKNSETFKKRAFIINSLITAGSAVWFSISHKYGIQYQGLNHYLMVLMLNVVALLLLWWLSLKTTSWKSFIYSLALPYFLVWIAFPYFGEVV